MSDTQTYTSQRILWWLLAAASGIAAFMATLWINSISLQSQHVSELQIAAAELRTGQREQATRMEKLDEKIDRLTEKLVTIVSSKFKHE